MDSSISHDPFVPDTDLDSPDARRLLEIGATSDEVRTLAAHPDLASLSQGDLRELLAALREPAEDTPEPEPEPVVSSPANDDKVTADNTRKQAEQGPWVDAEPLTIDGVTYPTWNLAHGWSAILVGNELNGIHLLAPTRDDLIALVRGQVKLYTWQQRKNLVDAQNRVKQAVATG